MKYLGILRDVLMTLVGIFLLVFFLSWTVVIIAVVLLGFLVMRAITLFKQSSGQAKNSGINSAEDANGVYEAEFTVEEQKVVDDD